MLRVIRQLLFILSLQSSGTAPQMGTNTLRVPCLALCPPQASVVYTYYSWHSISTSLFSAFFLSSRIPDFCSLILEMGLSVLIEESAC